MSNSAESSAPRAFGGNNGKIEIVQVWRFFAAVVVVLAHAYSRLARVFPESIRNTFIFAAKPTRTWGHLGVDFFFVISGFIMIWTCRDRFRTAGACGTFLAKRIARVVPVYWVATSLGVALLIFIPRIFSFGQHFELKWIASSYLFLPSIAPDGSLFSPVIGLGWTLNYEMYFYLIFSIALLMRRTSAILWLSLFFPFSAILGSIIDFRNPLLVQNTSWLLMEFLLGIWVGGLFLTGRRLNVAYVRVIFWICALLLLSTLFIDPVRDNVVGLHFTRFIAWGIPCAGLLYASLLMPQTWLSARCGKLFVRLGNASYSIYIFQVFALPAVAFSMRAVGLSHILHIDAIILLLTFCSILIGYAGYLLVEQPLSSAAQRISLYAQQHTARCLRTILNLA